MEKFNKSEVQFENPAKGMDHCSECRYFEKPHSCDLVTGYISPGAWCKKFAKRSAMAKQFRRGA